MSYDTPPSPPDPSRTPTAQEEAPDSDLLLGLFSGKRQRERHPCHVPATLDGARGAAAATVLDLSEGGALLQIDDPRFLEADSHGGLQGYLELLQVHAQPGLQLNFPQQDLRLDARVVRWTAGSAGGEPSRVGVRFERALAPGELEALRCGAPVPACAAPSAPSRPTHVPQRGARLQALVFLALKPEVGPLFSGAACAFGPELLVLRIPAGLGEPELRRRLASGALFVSILESPRVLYESTARLTSLVPTADGGFDLTLAPRGSWPVALANRLRRA